MATKNTKNQVTENKVDAVETVAETAAPVAETAAPVAETAAPVAENKGAEKKTVCASFITAETARRFEDAAIALAARIDGASIGYNGARVGGALVTDTDLAAREQFLKVAVILDATATNYGVIELTAKPRSVYVAMNAAPKVNSKGVVKYTPRADVDFSAITSGAEKSEIMGKWTLEGKFNFSSVDALISAVDGVKMRVGEKKDAEKKDAEKKGSEEKTSAGKNSKPRRTKKESEEKTA